MCGINGIYSYSPINYVNKRIENMNNAISHRGPNNSSYKLISNNLVFGHRRLSIIDINSRSNQPMTANSGRWTIIFNGEIYNFLKLKESLDYNFKTTSDTEVILAFVEKYGVEKLLKVSNGMFAIALYDNKEEKLYLARDRFGIKPLYYFLDDEKIVFSSEIKGILNSGLVEAKFNEKVIDEYLGYRYVREPYTFFEDILQLEAGSYITIDKNMNTNQVFYWDLPTEFNVETVYNEEEIANEFESKLLEAIERRLIADVPLGTYLSGGVDSSLITAVTTKLLEKQISTYTIGFQEMNEFNYADIVAKRYNTDHHAIEINFDEYITTMEEVIMFKDSPLAVPNEIALAIMSKILKEKITVVLSGEGADELLGGYGKIFRTPFDYANRNNGNESFYKYFINKYEYVPRKIRDKYLSNVGNMRSLFDMKVVNEFNKNNSNEESVFKFFHKYHIKGLLQRVDTTTMLASVEARVPFLDYELVEYSYKNIPYEMKLRWKNEGLKEKSRELSSDKYSEIYDIPKYLLKKIGYKYLPREIIERKKLGFPVPLSNWINSLEEMAKEILNNAYWLKVDKLDELFEDTKENPRAGQIIWMFLNVEIFRKKYFTKQWTY